MGKEYSGNLNKNEMKMVKQNAPKPKKLSQGDMSKLIKSESYFRSLAFSKK